ncbi:Coenzyme F420 hydrogenase/dehydrogenase, beta subunit C-terminal domain [Streptococcus sp. P25B114]
MTEGLSPNATINLNESLVATELFGSTEDINFDKKIGYYTSLYIGHVLEGSYREKASSGGFGTWIFKQLFENDLIDGVIHVKENKNGTDVMFSYQISNSLDEIREGAKTKYYPVELSNILKIVKETPGRYAVIGIPSFIYALRLLSKKDPIIDKRLKFMIGLVCGHQKSSKFTDFLGWQLGFKPGDITYINYRKKLEGRRSSDYGIEIHGYINNRYVEKISPISDLMGQDWGQGWFKTFASDYSDDVFNETADIVLGDAWLPEYTSDSKGNNIIIVRNTILDKIIRESLNLGKIKLDIVDVEKIYQSQESHYRHTHEELAYRLYKRDKEGIDYPIKRVQSSNNISFGRRLIQDLREIISIRSHIYFKRAEELGDINYFINRMKPLQFIYLLTNKLIRLLS